MQKDKQFYNRFYTKYPVNVHDSAPRFIAVSDLLSGRVLDIACGTGTLAKYYSGDYTGVDISDIAIKKARVERRKDARFLQANFVKDEFVLSEKFDCAYIGEFLEHIEDDKIVFDNVLSMVRPNGRIVVSVPNGDRVPDESHCRIFTVASIRRDYSKYGKINFHIWKGFHDRILFSIELGEVDHPEVTLVMIAKNEAKGIEKSIISALPFVDRVVVSVDTATIDETRKIAEMYADELRDHKWADDFSKARNEASVNVKTRWILFLDGHEYIESFGDIKEKLICDVDGIFVTVRMESGVTFVYPRIYRTGLQFKNAVHNLVHCQTRRASLDFVIVHDRINLQDEEAIKIRNDQRDEMMPKFLRKQIKEDKRNARAHFHLANYLMMRQDPKGAIKHFNFVIKYGYSVDEKYMAYMSKGRIHLGLGHTFRALWSFNKADELIPKRWESMRALGGFYLLQEDWKKASEYLVLALEPNRQHYSYEPMKQNKMEIWDLIGHCFRKLGQNSQALIAWNRAEELADTELLKKYFGEKIKFLKMILAEGEGAKIQIPVTDKNTDD